MLNNEIIEVLETIILADKFGANHTDVLHEQYQGFEMRTRLDEYIKTHSTTIAWLKRAGFGVSPDQLNKHNAHTYKIFLHISWKEDNFVHNWNSGGVPHRNQKGMPLDIEDEATTPQGE